VRDSRASPSGETAQSEAPRPRSTSEVSAESMGTAPSQPQEPPTEEEVKALQDRAKQAVAEANQLVEQIPNQGLRDLADAVLDQLRIHGVNQLKKIPEIAHWVDKNKWAIVQGMMISYGHTIATHEIPTATTADITQFLSDAEWD